jgi:hypothetical protein
MFADLDTIEECFQIVESEGTPGRDCLRGVPSPEQAVWIPA